MASCKVIARPRCHSDGTFTTTLIGAKTYIGDNIMRTQTVRVTISLVVLVLVLVLILLGLTRLNLTALKQPGHVETRFADLAKRLVIRHASRQGIPPRPSRTNTSIDTGNTQYGLDCALCHGNDGHGQDPPGRWMYPRAADLTSKQVQSYSDQELFWILQNGIRFTGMPAFGKVESSDHIWDIVDYVRTLPGVLRGQKAAK